MLLSASGVSSLGFALGPVTQAVPQHRPAPVARDDLADHVRRGDQARWSKRWAEAAAAYQDALKVADQADLPAEKRAPILGELALCELAQGKHRDAAEHLELAFKHRSAFNPDQQRRFLEGQKKAEREVALLFIGVEPPDAEVLVDGKPLAERKGSHLVFVEPGTHTVRARLTQYEDGYAEVETPKGSWPGVALRLTKLPDAPAERPSVKAPPPPRAEAVASSSDTAATYRNIGLIGASGGALLGIGLAAYGVALDEQVEDRSSALARRGGGLSVCGGAAFKDECAELRGLITARDVSNNLALGTLIVSGVLGAVSLSSFWWAPSDRRRASVEVAPTVTGKQAGAVLRGVW